MPFWKTPSLYEIDRVSSIESIQYIQRSVFMTERKGVEGALIHLSVYLVFYLYNQLMGSPSRA